MLKDFKDFVMRGNVLDLAVAVIVGAAFGPIVTSMVNDIVMPPIGLLLGHLDFKDFVMRGNVLDLAVAVIVGAAFGPIVTSMVNDIVMPPIGLLLGHVDF